MQGRFLTSLHSSVGFQSCASETTVLFDRKSCSSEKKKAAHEARESSCDGPCRCRKTEAGQTSGFQPPEPWKSCNSGTAGHLLNLEVPGVATEGQMRHTEIKCPLVYVEEQCENVR